MAADLYGQDQMDTDGNRSSDSKSVTVSLQLCDTLIAHGGIQDMAIGMIDAEASLSLL